MKSTYRVLPLRNVRIEDQFWSKYGELIRDVVIPYQWDALNDRIADAEPSYAIRNFRIAAGQEVGQFGGFVFQDSDLAKWLEAVAYSLTTLKDPSLERIADEAIDLIADAQQEDGYINTYFTIKAPDKRWSNLADCHELYVAGHMIEAAVAYYEATGKRKFLDVVSCFADYIDTVFGIEDGKIKGYDGHQEIELALVKLYKVTGQEKYLRLSQYFLDQRGQEPNFFVEEWEARGQIPFWPGQSVGPASRPNLKYNQSYTPVREQKEAHGHAVRAVYMYTAMADVAAQTGDEGLLQACRTLWDNIVDKQMYITGGIGSTHHGEAFTFDYDLPNDTIYAETCASIGLIFFAQRMLQIESNSKYADVIERALYNNVIGSMSLDGKHYFYVNPLEVWPKASEGNPGKHHVKSVRQKWFGCSCCPPNVARLVASLGEYIYSVSDTELVVNQYIGGVASATIGGQNLEIRQETNYPWDGRIKIELTPENEHTFTLGLRIPDWCQHATLRINDEECPLSDIMRDGYARVERTWKAGDIVQLDLAMDVQLIQSHPQLRVNAGKVAIQRGPLVYCVEEFDNDAPLASITVLTDQPLSARFDSDLLGGMMIIEGDALLDEQGDWGNELYRPLKTVTRPVKLRAIPYNSWGNREAGEMSVWIRRK
ncbi:glycoside hydrolase family 127 protein [Paenibacillus sp. FA6]|uniref:glycoside hydrolase family 127 protein n=1 Tax=Paenibacillus sp. FA6 TaxID=3413029 RepID=UPI003F659C51